MTNNAKHPFEDADDADLLDRMQRDPQLLDEVLEQLAPLLAADGIDIQNLKNVDPSELHAAMMRAIERHQLELHTPVGKARALTVDTLRNIAQALYDEKPTLAEQLFQTMGLEATESSPSRTYATGVALETLDSVYSDTKLRTSLGVVRLPELTDVTRAAAQEIQTFALQGRAFNSRDTLVTTHSPREVARAAIYLLAATVAAIAEHGNLQFSVVLDQLLTTS